jgi:hypothetical protein
MADPQNDRQLVPSTPGNVTAAAPDFDALVEMVAPHDRPGLVSQASARVYPETYVCWHAWATYNRLDPLDLTFGRESLPGRAPGFCVDRTSRLYRTEPAWL